MEHNPRKEWDAYRDRELALLRPRLAALGYTLDADQPHLKGERFLMQAVTTTAGRKLILLAKREVDGLRVVVKATSDTAGRKELMHERESRQFLTRIDFAYQPFYAPEELFWQDEAGQLMCVQEYIAQEVSFLERSVAEQFEIALAALKGQEGAHATTYQHTVAVRSVFGSHTTQDYLRCIARFASRVTAAFPEYRDLLGRVESHMRERRTVLEQYGGFLTHTDFVPHNFRIREGKLYLLDHSSLRFANKYEGWARFANFMALYNRELAEALVTYVRANRTPEESEAFFLMRLYRLGEILSYYVGALEKSEGDLRALNEARIVFWAAVLAALLDGNEVAPEVRALYEAKRDALRSPEEKERQKGLH